MVLTETEVVTLEALKYFYINQETRSCFFNLKSSKMSQLALLNTYAMGLRPIFFYSLSAGIDFKSLTSDVYRSDV